MSECLVFALTMRFVTNRRYTIIVIFCTMCESETYTTITAHSLNQSIQNLYHHDFTHWSSDFPALHAQHSGGECLLT